MKKSFYIIEDLSPEWGATPSVYSNEETYRQSVSEFRSSNPDWDWDGFPTGETMTIDEIVERLKTDRYFSLNLEMAEVTDEEYQFLQGIIDNTPTPEPIESVFQES